MSTELIERARAGDEAAFEQLIGPHRHEIQAHCYRFLGSVADAEDAFWHGGPTWRGLPSSFPVATLAPSLTQGLSD
jgi:RNA polymerase sigma-70 factor (ECF subfamily)